MTDMTMQEAVKRAIAIAEEPDSDMPRYRFDEWQKRMFAALEEIELASGDLIPRSDAEMAVALVVEKAAHIAKRCVYQYADPEPPIRALAPADALAEVQAMRAGIRHVDEVNDMVLMELASDEAHARAEAAEAKLEALVEAGQRLYEQAAHVLLGASIGKYDITGAAKNLKEPLDGWDAALERLRAALAQAGKGGEG